MVSASYSFSWRTWVSSLFKEEKSKLLKQKNNGIITKWLCLETAWPFVM
jgi:hypothetical protein